MALALVGSERSFTAANMSAAKLQSTICNTEDEAIRTKLSQGAGDELRRKLSRWAVEANEKSPRKRCDSDAGVLMKNGVPLEISHLVCNDFALVDDDDGDENCRSLVVEDYLKDVTASCLGNVAYGSGSMLADFSDFSGHWRKSEGKRDVDLYVESGRWGLHGQTPEQEIQLGASGSFETNGWSLVLEKSSKSTLVWVNQQGEERTWRRIALEECRAAVTDTKVARQPEGKGSRMRWLFCVPRRAGVEN